MGTLRWLAVFAVLALVATACAGSDSETATTEAPAATTTTKAAPEEPAKVGLVQIDLTHPFHIGEVEGANEAARRYGFDLSVTSGEGDITKQINAFENLLEQGIDSIAVNAIDVTAYGPALETAKEKGIPVVLLHSESPLAGTILGLDELATGQAVGEYAVTLLTEKYGEPKGKVAILQGLLGQGLNEDRTGGFTQVMEDYDGIEVVAMEPTNWDPQRATEITENLLVAYPDLDMIYGLSDGLTVPAAQVVERAGMADQVILVSIDGSDFGLEAVQAGDLASTYLYASAYLGYWKGWIPYRVAIGDNVPSNILLGGALVTPENVDLVLELVTDMQDNIETFDFERPLQEILNEFEGSN